MREYARIHTTRQSLVMELKLLIDEYIKKDVTEEEVMSVLSDWKENSAKLLLDESSPTTLAKRTGTLIGARRSAVVQTILNAMKK